MPYTKTPEFSTYKTVPIMFNGTTAYRYGDLSSQRDCNIVNMFYDRIGSDKQNSDTFLQKRPGLRATAYNMTKSLAADVLRGDYYDAASNRLYWAVNNKVYSVTPDSGTTIRTVCTLTTSSGFVGFCEFLQTSTNTRFVLISDGTDLWVDNYGATSCSKVVDADMPTPHIPQPISLNGYVVLADVNSGDLYNSDNDDPTAWTTGNYITAEMSADFITWIAQNRNYIVAFGTNSIEMFWDSANLSGSPFSRNDSGYRNVGYVTGLKQIGNVLFFVGQDRNASLGVYVLDGFNLNKISNSVVDRTLQPVSTSDNNKGQVNLNKAGHSLMVNGHLFYALVTTQTTWLYDIENNQWFEWRGSDDTYLKIEGTWTMLNGSQYVAIAGQTYISQLSPTVYQDFGSNFDCIFTTERFTVGSLNQKIMHRLTIFADEHLASGTSNITVTWSDDDWVSTTGTRDINLFTDIPKDYMFGQFRSRSLRFNYSDNYPLRLRGIELEINVGVN